MGIAPCGKLECMQWLLYLQVECVARHYDLKEAAWKRWCKSCLDEDHTRFLEACDLYQQANYWLYEIRSAFDRRYDHSRRHGVPKTARSA